jgi:hypothetical protein
MVRDRLYVDGQLYQGTDNESVVDHLPRHEPMEVLCSKSYRDVTRSAPVQPCPKTRSPELCNTQPLTSGVVTNTVIRSDPRQEDTRSVQVKACLHDATSSMKLVACNFCSILLTCLHDKASIMFQTIVMQIE